ncbi:MAG TPA: TetR/AcrR family transcriptional regulator, partial [Marmoricola sp.]
MGREVEGSGASVRSIKPPDVRKGEIVAATRALFTEQGLSRTTLKDVAERVGVTRGLIYHYFGDMDGLVEVVLEAYVAEFV